MDFDIFSDIVPGPPLLYRKRGEHAEGPKTTVDDENPALPEGP